jgi:alpha-1,6-mannosyltransferase
MPMFDRRYRALLPHRFLFPVETRIWRLLDRHRPAVVEVSDKYSLCHLAGLIKRRPGPRPTLIGFSQERMDDSLEAQLGLSAARRLARWYMPSVYLRQFDAHLANSAYTAAELIDAASSGGPARPLLWRLRDRIHVAPLGVDAAGFSPSLRSEGTRRALLARFGAPDTARVVVFAGRLSPEKHAADLIPAIRLAAERGLDVRLVIAGDGPMLTSLAQEAGRQAPGRVLFVGHVNGRRHLGELLASADVFLHPNPREPFGIGPLEAMACGTPVVLPRSGGVLTYASAATAWLCTPGPHGLADGLSACLARPEEAVARAAAARLRVDDYGWPAVAHRYFDAYDRIDVMRRTMWAADASQGSTVRPLTIS